MDGTLPVPQGWDEWYGKVSEDALYFNYQLIEKTGTLATPHITFYGDQPDDYQTDVFSDRAVNFVKDKSVSSAAVLAEPLVQLAARAIRSRRRGTSTGSPARRCRNCPGFNEKDISDKPKWLRKQAREPLRQEADKLIDNERRRQEEQLISVDQAVGELVASA